MLGVPADEESWSPRLRIYFKAISQFHARPKDTLLGMLMVTNLSSFPSALTVIPVPDGDVKKHRDDFIVNENLKRLGCSGRSGMSLSTPAGATQAKFLQLYKTSDRIPHYGAVLEMVKLCQVALLVFGKLEQQYADGLLCDVTEKAINDWWTDIGSEYYNNEPTDGILGPTTVAALLGLLMGARNRLNYYGAPVAKDAFDVISLKRGIAYFQKYQKLDRTRRLDRHTLNRLHKVTAKAAAGEGWAVPKAVKSTVAELSGKGGEMVMGMVGRDKAGIGEIETLDIDRFVTLIHGQRGKWLWYGKPRRDGTSDYRTSADMDNLTFSKDDRGGYIWSNNRSETAPLEDDLDLRKKEKESPNDVYTNQSPGSATSVLESPFDRDPALRKNVLRSVTGKMNDARSGFGRIKDAVGLRGHGSKHSKDEGLGGYLSTVSSTSLAPNSAVPTSPQTGVGKVFTWNETPAAYQNGSPKVQDPVASTLSPETLRDADSSHESKNSLGIDSAPSEETSRDVERDAQWAEQVREIRRTLVAADPSIGGSVCGDGDLEGPVLEADRDPNNFQVLLHRRHSMPAVLPGSEIPRNEFWWPRQMSFTDAEEAVLGWEPIGIDVDQDGRDPWVALQTQKCLGRDFQHLFEKVAELQDHIGPWVERQVDDIDALDDQAARDQDGFHTLYLQLSETYQSVKQNSQGILSDERGHVTELIKDLEVLGSKLQYEINNLLSKVQDVEDGVSQFERQVDDLEGRATELNAYLNAESWAQWLLRRIAPNFAGVRQR